MTDDESITIIKHFGVDIFCVRVTLPSHIIEREEERDEREGDANAPVTIFTLALLTPACLKMCTVHCTGCTVIT